MRENTAGAAPSYNPWQREIGFLARWRFAAWLPWLLLHVPASWFIVASGGPRGDLTPWLLYASVSCAACLVVVVTYFLRRGDILSYVIAAALWIAGPLLSATYEEKINPTPTAELRYWCERDAGLEIHRVVRAGGYYDTWTSAYSPWRMIMDTDYEFIEVCDSESNPSRPLAEPGCWRLTKVRRDSGQCHPGIDAEIKRRYAQFSKDRCLAADKLGAPRARYGRFGLSSGWELDNAWHSEMSRYVNFIRDLKTGEFIAKEIYYAVNVLPDAKPFPSGWKYCHDLETGYAFKNRLILNVVKPR